MKLLSAATVLLASTATAGSLSFFGSDAHKSDDETFPVPGDNPLVYCQPPDNFVLNVTKVDIDPNPPLAGKKLVIHGTGTLKEDVQEGAVVNIQVKYGPIRLLTQSLDLCEYAKEVDLECPLKAGDLKLSKEVELPREIPPGKYTVLADVLTAEEQAITCFTAEVNFSLRRAGAEGKEQEQQEIINMDL